jgi:hypothetical protein
VELPLGTGMVELMMLKMNCNTGLRIGSNSLL